MRRRQCRVPTQNNIVGTKVKPSPNFLGNLRHIAGIVSLELVRVQLIEMI